MIFFIMLNVDVLCDIKRGELGLGNLKSLELSRNAFVQNCQLLQLKCSIFKQLGKCEELRFMGWFIHTKKITLQNDGETVLKSLFFLPAGSYGCNMFPMEESHNDLCAACCFSETTYELSCCSSNETIHYKLTETNRSSWHQCSISEWRCYLQMVLIFFNIQKTSKNRVDNNSSYIWLFPLSATRFLIMAWPKINRRWTNNISSAFYTNT